MQADLGVAIDQLDRYRLAAPDLFVPNLVLVVSDGILTRVGSITSGRSRFMPWRPLNEGGGGTPTLEALIRGMFEPRALVDYLRTCVTFEEDERGEVAKKIAGYHQFRAVRKARASVLAHLKPPSGEGDGRGGVIWHTQGSGKSLTMLMLAGALIREPRMTNPTVDMEELRQLVAPASEYQKEADSYMRSRFAQFNQVAGDMDAAMKSDLISARRIVTDPAVLNMLDRASSHLSEAASVLRNCTP